MNTTPLLFPFAQYWWFYAGFTAFVLGVLALDLGVFHRKAHEVKFKEALGWSVFWVGLSLAFAWGFYQYALHALPLDPRLTGLDHAALAKQSALEYLTGFVVEKSLAVDNIFVFVVIFGYFAIPARYQHRVLFYGIIGALVFRMIFIALGAALMQYHALVIAFGVFLVFTGLKIVLTPDKPLNPADNPVIRWMRAHLRVTTEIDSDSLVTRREGLLHATPLFVALVFIELSDIVFAVDSVPAIFALTREPLIVFTSNIFAILGLRAMYFMLAGVVHRFRFLKYGLGAVLVFVGLKMAWLNAAFDGKFPITWSLAIIATCIGASVAASLLLLQKRA